MFKPLSTLPPVSRDAGDILKLFGPLSSPIQSLAKKALGVDRPILGCDLEYSETVRYVEEPTVLGVSDGFLTVSVPFEEGITFFKELRQLHPNILFVGHAFTSADKFAFAQVGEIINLEDIEDTIIRFFLANAHLCKTGSKLEDGDGEKRGKGYMNLWTFLSIYTDFYNYKDCWGTGCRGEFCPKHDVWGYNGADSSGPLFALPQLLFQSKVRGVDKLYPLHRELAYVLGEMSRYGVQVDREYLFGDKGKGTLGLQGEFELNKRRIEESLPFNPKSNKEAVAYFKGKGIELSDWQETTIREKVEEESDAELALSLDYKELGNGTDRWFAPLGKDKSGNWTGYLDSNSKIHPRLGIFTSTGRLSAQSPNLQNVSSRRVDRHTCECKHDLESHSELLGCSLCVECKKFRGVSMGKMVRRAIIASPGHYLISADFSNAENRMFLHLSGHHIPNEVDLHAFVAEKANFTTDMEIVKVNKGNPREAAKTVQHGCVTGEHEVLTPEGWVRIDSWKGEDVAQWKEGGEVDFVCPTKYHTYDVKEELIAVSNTGIQQLVTSNHEFPVMISGTWRDRKYNKLHRKTVEQFGSGRIPITGVKTPSEQSKWDDDTIRRDVAVQADANLRNNYVQFHLHKERKQKRVKMLFGVEGKPCGCHPKGMRYRFPYSPIFLSPDKSFNKNLLLLDQSQRQVFLDELLLWDGSNSGFHKRYGNSNYTSVKWVQTIAHLSGVQALVRDVHGSGFNPNYRGWEVSLNRRKFTDLKGLKKEKVEFDGKVYCFTIPSGFFLVRYKDTISVTGNSFYLEGIQVKYPRELLTSRIRNEIDMGAREVWSDWKLGEGIVTFTGSNLSQRVFGDKTFVNRKKALSILKILFDTFPGAREFQQKIGKQMEREKAVITPHGYYLLSFGPSIEDRIKTAAAMFGCLSPETLVLKSDLTWVPNGDLKVGDELIGIEEFPRNRKQHRRMLPSKVLSIDRIILPSCRVVTDKGEVICSLTHPWLTRTQKTGSGKWIEAGNLKVGNEISFLASPWEQDTSYEAGYLAGALDGEGTADRLRFYQTDNGMLQYFRELLVKKGFSDYRFSRHRGKEREAAHYKTEHSTNVRSLGDRLSLGGSIGLKRIDTRKLWEGVTPLNGRYLKRAKVLSVENIGDRELIGMETSTKTFVANGMFTHNSNPVAHLTKLALVDLWRKFVAGRPLRPILQIHDEILCEVSLSVPPEEAAEWLRESMERETPEIPGLILPIGNPSKGELANWGKNWADKVAIKVKK